MWSTILLFIRKHLLKNKLSKLEKKKVAKEAVASAIGASTRVEEKEIKKVKKQLNIVNASLLVSILAIAIVIILVMIVLFYSMLFIMDNAGQNIVLNQADTWNSGEEEKDWNWILQQEQLNGELGGPLQEGLLEISGGIYPKDPKLKAVAILLELMQKSCDLANAEYGEARVTPANLISLFTRETGGSILNDCVADTSLNIYTDLIYRNPICGKGSGCKWMNGGTSHFIGGSVSGGKDTANVATAIPNTDASIQSSYGGDHALGYGQFEVTSLSGEWVKAYPVGDYASKAYNDSTDRWKLDSTLGFIRPNLGYIPDQVCNVANHLASDAVSGTKKEWERVQSEAWFMGLSNDEKAYAYCCYRELNFMGGEYIGEGSMAYISRLLELCVGLKADGHINQIQDLIHFAKVKYPNILGTTADNFYNNAKCELVNPGGSSYTDIINTILYDTSLGPNTTAAANKLIAKISADTGGQTKFGYYSDARTYRNGSAMIIGYESNAYYAYIEMVNDVNAAEKDVTNAGAPIIGASNGGWLEYPGSGYFASFGSKYYSSSVRATVYRQTYADTKWADASWGWMELDGVSKNTKAYNKHPEKLATMSTGGCGIYSLSFIASNLHGSDLNPGYCRELLDKALARDGRGYSGLLTNCLWDTGVVYLAKELGLSIRTENFTNKTDQQFEELVINELKKGNMVLGVWKGGPSQWYTGDGHFMVIRGYNNTNNKLRVFTSAPPSTQGYDIEKACLAEETAGNAKRYLSTNRDYVWIVGLPENMT